jgi:Zn-finger nucleic acid-binding protein
MDSYHITFPKKLIYCPKCHCIPKEVSQCDIYGHSFCSKCHPEATDCSVCNCLVIQTRNRLAQKVGGLESHEALNLDHGDHPKGLFKITAEALECPICLQLPLGKRSFLLNQCENGHSVCGNCKSKIQCSSKIKNIDGGANTRCPVCRGQWILTRNHWAEQILINSTVSKAEQFSQIREGFKNCSSELFLAISGVVNWHFFNN